MILCRACANVRAAGDVCPACGEDSAVAHDELTTLTLAHLDCDAFYASIEKRDDPSIAAKPVIVGGGKRGVVSTCCYIARAYGVRSAMPMYKARQLCPDATIVRPRMSAYVEEGRLIRKLMQDMTPLVQPLSIDEAFMDLSGLEALHGAAPAQMLARLQNHIEAERRLTVSIGLSFNKFLAKMASDFDKPRGFSIIGRADALDVLAVRSVGALPGVGPQGAKTLEARGLRTIGDIRAFGHDRMKQAFGEWGERLFALSIAQDSRRVDPYGERKSISAETTFFEDIRELGALEDQLWPLCEKVAIRCRAADMAGRTLTLKLRDQRFRTITRRRQIAEPTLLAARIFEIARGLLAADADGVTAFRLIGLGLADFTDAEGADKGDLMDARTPKLAAAEGAVAKARARFGTNAVKTGRGLKIDDEDA